MIRLTPPLEVAQAIAMRESLCAARMATLIAAWQGITEQRNAPDFYMTDGGAALSVLGDGCTLEGNAFDADELREFLRMRGCTTLVCSGEAARKFGVLEDMGAVFRPVLRYVGGEESPYVPELKTAPSLAQIYCLLCEAFDNMADVRFDAWYADVSHKQRRGLAQIYGVQEDGAICATAGIYYQNMCAAVIGSVATRAASRGRGYAGALVTALARMAELGGKTALIAAKNTRAEEIYTRLGFVRYAELGELSMVDPHSPVETL